MILRALRPFAAHPRVREIVAVVPEVTAPNPPAWLAEVDGRPIRVVAGGDTRAGSVYRGVQALTSACSVVVIHDAARPFVRADTIDAVIVRASEGTAAVAAVPVGDTLKRADETGQWVSHTVDRVGLWRAQTPQAFPRAVLDEAYRHVGSPSGLREAYTDEAALVEGQGHPVLLVCDSATNIKVTTAEDFVTAERLAAR